MHRVFVGTRGEVYEQKGEVCELARRKDERKRWVRMEYSNFINELDATWFQTETEALLAAAMQLDGMGREILERAQQLRTRAGEV
ncbi:MAG: hypothetical protein KGR24_07960 [Planctomycetes bacterium]|nr:hypothetical protein [Planctomycetota bacterium]